MSFHGFIYGKDRAWKICRVIDRGYDAVGKNRIVIPGISRVLASELLVRIWDYF
jgi:hypothetical protein